MSYNRITALIGARQKFAIGRVLKNSAFVPVPQAVTAGGLQPWQQSLYAWARAEAVKSIQSKPTWLRPSFIENN
jgi:hypothetical protein